MMPDFFILQIIKYRRWKFKRREKKSPDFLKRKSFYSKFLGVNDMYFDIGANFGNRIAPINSLKLKTIVAVEPQEKCCEVLRENFQNIIVLQMGMGSSCTEKTFYIADDPVLSSFSPNFIDSTKDTRFIGHTWQEGTTVKVATLDSLILEYGIPKFIKIDVEGYEHEVLKGLSYPVKYISFEYTVPELEQNLLGSCSRLMEIASYTFNYSVGESMALEFNDWQNFDEFMVTVNSNEFKKTGFGDIYVSLTHK